jgi:hypothetical protein
VNNKPYIFALSVGVLLFFSGCKSADLKALDSAVAIIQLQKGGEVSRSYRDKDVVLGKPIYAKARIAYEPINNYNKKEVFDEIVAILGKNNWERDEWNIVPNAFKASLQQGDFKILTTVLLHLDKNLVTVYMEVH